MVQAKQDPMVLWSGPHDWSQQLLEVEQHEWIVLMSSHGFDDAGIHAGEGVAAVDRVGRDGNEIYQPPDPEPTNSIEHLEHDDGPFVVGVRRPAQEPVTVNDGQKGAPDVDQAVDHVGNTRKPGDGHGRDHLPSHPRGDGAHQVADLENQNPFDRNVSHLY